MAFYVGQKVVCVDDSPNPEGMPLLLKNGEYYTIKATASCDGIYGVQLIETYAPKTVFRAPYFNSARFRPVVGKKTDIGIFTAMLTPKHQRENA